MTETEQYWEDMRDMMLTPGWKHLKEELQANADVINSVFHTKDEADLKYRQGQLNIIGTIVNLEQTVENAEAQDND